MSIAGFVPDLMDRSKLVGVRFVRSVAELHDAPEPTLLVDLGRAAAADAVAELAASGRRVIAFTAHVDRAAIDTARAVGCEAYPRSELFRRWPEIAAG